MNDMKILIVMAGFFPGKKYGGPPVSVDNFCSLMSEDDCYVVTHNHDKDEHECYTGIQSGKWIDRGNCLVMYLSDDHYCKEKFEKIIQDICPDIMYLQGLFQECVLPCLQLAKKYNIKVLLAPRGELCEGAFKKKYKKIPYILILRLMGLLKNVYYQSTSEEETRSIIKYLDAHDNKVYFLTNIPSIPRKEYLRQKKESGHGKFIFLSRIHSKKNLISAIQYLKDVEGKVSFDIYGPIEENDDWSECQKEIEKLPDNVKVSYCGLVSHDEVHEVFSKYDAFIFPTFSENYGHVIAEALIVGTPVVLGKGTTPWDDINGKAGFVAELNDKSAFTEYLNDIIKIILANLALKCALFNYILYS